MEKKTVDFIDWWNNILWLIECLIDIYCDVVDLYYVDKDIKDIVSNRYIILIRKII